MNNGISRSKSFRRSVLSGSTCSATTSSKSSRKRMHKRPRMANVRIIVSPVLHILGSSLGIAQLWRLFHIMMTESGAIVRHDDIIHVDRPDGSTRSRPREGEQITLFPPYMFYTAKNITQAEMDSKIFRSHCRNLNPKYELITYDDNMSRRFVSKYYPEWLELYDGLDVPVMQADMWRYLILHKYGGVYLDGDVDCKKPIDTWGKVFNVQIGHSNTKTNANHTAIGAMVGIEYRRPLRPSVTGGKPYPDKFQVAQWTMAGQPGHYIYYRTVELINQTITRIRSGGTPPGDAVYITGPVQFSHAVVDYMLQQGRIQTSQIASNPPENHDILIFDGSISITTDELIGNMALLHEDAFSYRGRNIGPANNEDHPTVYARHWYAGGWKTKGWKKMSERDAQKANLRMGGGDVAQAAKEKKNQVIQIKTMQRVKGQTK